MTNCKILLQNPYGRAIFSKTTTQKLLKSLKQLVAFCCFLSCQNISSASRVVPGFLYTSRYQRYIADLLWISHKWTSLDSYRPMRWNVYDVKISWYFSLLVILALCNQRPSHELVSVSLKQMYLLMFVVKDLSVIKAAVRDWERPDLAVITGPETLAVIGGSVTGPQSLGALIKDWISRCWHQDAYLRPTFTGMCDMN